MEKKKSLLVAIGGILLGLFTGYFVGVNKGGKETPSVSLADKSGSCGVSETSNNLFELDGTVYNENSISSALKNNLFELKNESYTRQKGVVDEFALTVYLGKKKNIKVDPEHMPRIEQVLPDVKVSDSDLKDFFNKNKDRLPPNTKLETIKAQLEQYLKSQKMAQIFTTELEKLNKEGKYKYLVLPPPAPVVNLDITGYPTKGSKDSRYVLIEASDYTCGHCKIHILKLRNL